MHPRLRITLAALTMISAMAASAQAQNGRYDLRLQLVANDTVNREALVDVLIRASSAPEQFKLAGANVRLTLASAIPVVAPPIQPPDTNPTDRSVYIQQEGEPSGFLAQSNSLYDPHTLTDSAGNVVSYNIVLASGAGIAVSASTWHRLGQLRFDTDPGGGIANLTLNDSKASPGTIVLQTTNTIPYPIPAGTSSDLAFDTDVAYPCASSVGDDPMCPAGHHGLGGPFMSVSGVPEIGETITFDGTNLHGILAGLVLGTNQAPIPLSGLIGSTVPGSAACINTLDTALFLGSTSASLSIDLPPSPVFCGVAFGAQWADFTGTGFDVGTSRALTVVVGGS